MALEEWLTRFPEFAMADKNAEVQWSRGPVRGPRQLNLVYLESRNDDMRFPGFSQGFMPMTSLAIVFRVRS